MTNAKKSRKGLTQAQAPQIIDPIKDTDSVNIEESSEKWSQCTLEDGTIVRVKPVIVDVRKTRNMFDAEGKPIYLVKTTVITDVQAAPSKGRK